MTKQVSNIIYVICPFSSPDSSVESKRFSTASAYAGHLLYNGFNAYSPLSHGYPISLSLHESENKTIPYKVWIQHGLLILKMCTEAHVLKLEGWRESKGVSLEIQEAKKLGIPIKYIDLKNEI